MNSKRFELYEDKSGEWRWRFIASNNRIIADSGEGYANKEDAKHGIDLVKREAPDAPVKEYSCKTPK